MYCQDQLSLNADQKYCQGKHSAILLTFIKLPFVIKISVLLSFEWPFYNKWNFCSWFLPQHNIGVSSLCLVLVL